MWLRIYNIQNQYTKYTSFDPSNIKIDEKSYKNIFIYYIGYVSIKDSKYITIYSVNPLYIFQKKKWIL